jgi:hypothetical protein
MTHTERAPTQGSSAAAPELGNAPRAAQRPMYTALAVFVTALVGGGFCGLVMHHLNSRRLGRVREDLGYQLLLAAGWVALVAVLARAPTEPVSAGAHWLGFIWPGGVLRRLGALTIAAAATFRHRSFYQAGAGMPSADGWAGALTALVIGVPLDLAVEWLAGGRLG